MEPIPQIVRQRMQAAAKPAVHPDPDLLTALAERALNEPERDQVLRHLSVCADCREILALAQPQFELEQATAAVVAARRTPRGWFHGSMLRWGAAAACLVVVSAAVLLRYQSRGRLTAYSSSSSQPPAPLPVAREATENHPLDQGAASSSGTDKLTELQQDSQREQYAMDFQAANELAVKQQARKDLGTPGNSPQKKATPWIRERAIAGIFGSSQAKGALAGAAGAAAAPPAPSPTAPAFSAKVVGGQMKTNKSEAQLDGMQLPPSSEAVTVTADAPSQSPASQITESVEVSAAQTAAPAASPEARSKIGNAGGNYATLSVQQQNQVALRKAANSFTPSWTLSSDGTMLMRSQDSGKTWQTITVASNVAFRAVSAVGPEVWAGGLGGALYHSSDAGRHWTRVEPENNGQTLTADIVALEFTDARHGKLTTANHEAWTTSDAGWSWQKQ